MFARTRRAARSERPGAEQPAVTDAGDRRTVPVPEGLDGERVDAALARMFGLSRAKAAGLVAAGQVLADGHLPAKSDRVTAGSWLEVTLPPPPVTALQPGPVPGLEVVYSDADIVVVDKPVGVAAHPAPGWSGPTVIEGLLGAGYTIATGGAAERQGVVHRLDVNTTGLMVVAKSERAYSALKRAFRERAVDKGYHALVQGHPDPLRGTIDAPIDRHPSGDGRFAVVAGGRPSVTHYDTIEAFRAASLLDIRLETGRTHQIRVHMAAVRHPCVGDRLYGADPVLAARLGLDRQWLHAARLGFRHPGDGRKVEFTSAYPPDLAHALDLLRAES
jgi:23S rRNA pseudouridine1911/1915/1917 synthase